MYKILSFLLSVLCVGIVHAQDINSEVIGTYDVLFEDVYVNQDGKFFVTKAFVDVDYGNSLKIENHGLFQPGELEICAGCDVIFENYNFIDVETVVLNDGAQIFQTVSNIDNMIAMNLGTNYTTVVHGDMGLSLADVVDLSDDSNVIVLNNVTLNINKVPLNKSKHVVIGDNVTLVIGDLIDGGGVTVLDDVTNSASVRFVSDSNDVMFVNVGAVRDGKLYVERVRETDYVVIFDNDMGKFINALRYDAKNDNLMYALDSATDKDSLFSIMDNSVLFNPDVLVRPLQIINTINVQALNIGFENNVNANVFGIMSDDFYLYGADVNLVNVIKDKFKINIGVNISHMDYASSLDSFSGDIYGVNFGAGYLFENNMFVNLNTGLSFAEFNIPYVWYDDLINKPNASFGYVVTDAGYRFKADSFSIVPFAGFVTQFYDLAGYKYSEYMGHVGVDSEYRYVVSDLEYVYGVSVVADTDCTLGVSGKIGFMSPMDMIGGNIALSIISTYDSLSYKASVNAKLLF